jgi:hypothetical protein
VKKWGKNHHLRGNERKVLYVSLYVGKDNFVKNDLYYFYDLLRKLSTFQICPDDHKPSKTSGQKNASGSKLRNRKKFNSSDEESEEASKVSRKKASGSTGKSR